MMNIVVQRTAQVLEQAEGRWPGILAALGIDPQHLSGKGVPCPMCGGRDRFQFTDWHRRGGYVCRGCGNGDGMDLLMKYRGWDFKAAIEEVGQVVGTASAAPKSPATKDPRILLQRISKGVKPLAGSDPASLYLQARGLITLPAPLKYHPALAYFESGKRAGEYPTMVATVQDPEGEALTYHVTYLHNHGKAPVPSPRKIMTAVKKTPGSAVRLFPQASHIGIAEGIETAIAAHELRGLPVWAALNTSGLKAFAPPEGVRTVTVFADHDANFAGQAAAYELGRRLTAKGYQVYVVLPPSPGDFLDLLNQQKAAA